MDTRILRDPSGGAFNGCDFVLQLPEERRGSAIRILQLTDMQIIDATQRRTPDRIRPDEIAAWGTEAFDPMCGDHIRSLIAQSRPDLILLTGDLVYGSFDDSGSSLCYLCALMDSFAIPWAPVFGNHDNESAMGVAWQCEQLERSRYCLFRRGEVSGNGNYTVGIAIGDALIRVIHMLDSNGCRGGRDPSLIRERGIYPDQLALVSRHTSLIRAAQGRDVPAFMAFHIPIDRFYEAELAKGYRSDLDDQYVLGVDIPARDGDFGFSMERYGDRTVKTDPDFPDFLRAQGVDGVFAGHVHNNSFSISHGGIVWTFGLKTGQYDYHVPYQLGGTLITLEGDHFTVNHIPSLVRCAPMPSGAPMFKGLFAGGEG